MKVYDPITEEVYMKNQEGDLVNKSFYYFNMQKDQEEYIRDLQLKEQEKLANKNRQTISSASIRAFRKRRTNFNVLSQFGHLELSTVQPPSFKILFGPQPKPNLFGGWVTLPARVRR